MSIIKLHFLYTVSTICMLAMPGLVLPWYFNYKPSPVAQRESPSSAYLVTIMLVPGGDVRNHGRSLEHQFESSSSVACTLALKEAFEKTYPAVRVIMSHSAGDVVQPFQIATMANTLDVDLVFTINCYHEQGPKPALYLYQFSYGIDFVRQLPELAWCTVDSAYLCAQHTTRAWGNMLVQGLQTDYYAAHFTAYGPYKIPFKPLFGIKVPAFGIEMSLKQDVDWATYIDPLVLSCAPIINPLVKQRTGAEGP